MTDAVPAAPGPTEATAGTEATDRGTQRLVCSAKGCRREASAALLWNNPRLHKPQRRKVWLACEEHTSTLGEFLSLRGFLADTIGVHELTESHG